MESQFSSLKKVSSFEKNTDLCCIKPSNKKQIDFCGHDSPSQDLDYVKKNPTDIQSIVWIRFPLRVHVSTEYRIAVTNNNLQ